MKKLKLAIIGLAHPHTSPLYRTLAAHPDEVECIGFANLPSDDMTHEERVNQLGPVGKADLQAGRLREYSDWRELLKEKPDVAVVTADNRACPDICCELMKQRIVVINEKPMAMCYADAKRMATCSRENGVPIITNWPIAWFPAFRKAKELADAGAVGRVMRVTYRSPATWGPFAYGKPEEDKARTWWYRSERGGGSLLDYACYGTVLATWLFGRRAERVCAITKQFTTAAYSDVEDYSAMILDFGDGVGLCEGSWSTFNCGQIPTGPVIYGTEGTIVCDRYSSTVKVYRGAEHKPVDPVEMYETEPDRQVELLGRNIIDFLRGEAPLNDMLTLDINMDVVAALDAGIRSAESGQFVAVEQ